MKQYERDEIRLNELRQRINEEARNALLAKEAIEIAERYRRKADNQRLAIRDLLAKMNRPKGHWIVIDEYSACSVCDAEIDWYDLPYCPYCGAKMDGERSKE